jgi:hypothetical protein
MTRKYLHAEYRRPDHAIAAIEALTKAGIPKSALELYSRRPVETHPPVLPRRSCMSLVAVLTAITAGAVSTALVFRAQLDYPLVTGGMPITSGWATGVVTFETTMGGAVLGILLMFLWEAGLIGSRGGTPVPDLPEEGVVLQVKCEGDSAAIQGCLADTGASRIEAAEGWPETS